VSASAKTLGDTSIYNIMQSFRNYDMPAIGSAAASVAEGAKFELDKEWRSGSRLADVCIVGAVAVCNVGIGNPAHVDSDVSESSCEGNERVFLVKILD
jgi:hypothetical protein